MTYKDLIEHLNRAVLEKQQLQVETFSKELLKNKDFAGNEIKDYFNSEYNVYRGGFRGIPAYREQSVIREIFQNIIDCHYNEPVNINLSFDDTINGITFEYNESGFEISNIISFLSLAHSSKRGGDYAGTFGIGAKGAIVNAKTLTVNSHYFKETQQTLSLTSSFTINSIICSGVSTLFIENLSLKDNDDKKNGTVMTITFENSLYKRIKANLMDITGEKINKGEFLTPLDLAFASIKKENKEIKITVNRNNYYIKYNDFLLSFKHENNGTVLQVYKGNDSNFIYLIPVSRFGEDMPKFINDFRYNYFSTYELTGAISSENLPKFFINLPTLDKVGKYYITEDRKGIAEERKNEIEQYIKNDLKNMIWEFGQKNRFWFTPKSCVSYYLQYFYEFCMLKSWDDLKNDIRLNTFIKDDDDTYTKLCDIKFFEHDDESYHKAQKATNINFCFAKRYHGMLRPYTSSKYMEFSHEYWFRVNSVNFFVEQCKTYESGYILSIAKNLLIDLLNPFALKSHREILLLAIENLNYFTEEVLIDLFKILKVNRQIYREFNFEEKILTVGNKKYPLLDQQNIPVKIKNTKTLILACEIFNADGFYSFILDAYKKTLFNNEIENTSVCDKLRIYKAAGLTFAYEGTLLNVHIQLSPLLIDTIDISNVDYETLIEITGLTNYKLLQGKAFDENFQLDDDIANIYGFDLEKINSYTNISLPSLSQICFCSTQYNLGDEDLAAAIKDNVLINIDPLDTFNTLTPDYDFLVVFPKKNIDGKHSKIRINKIAKFLDKIFDSGNIIYSMYKSVDKPIVKMLDQFDYRLKPILPVSEDEFAALKDFLALYGHESISFMKDLNNKLFGYSTVCSFCGYKSDVINSFKLKENISYEATGKIYKLSLLLCQNDFYESDGWVISNVCFKSRDNIYNIGFNKWIETIRNNNSIDANLLRCKLSVSKKISYRLFDDSEDSSQFTEFEDKYITLTPLLAVKWCIDSE